MFKLFNGDFSLFGSFRLLKEILSVAFISLLNGPNGFCFKS